MARRLTTFSKLLMTMLIVGLLVFGGKCFLDNTDVGQDIKNQTESVSANDGSSSSGTSGTSSSSSSRVVVVQIIAAFLRKTSLK